MSAPEVSLDPVAFRAEADEVVAGLVERYRPEAWEPTLEADVRRARELQGHLYRSGLSMAGWPVEYGGRGGSPLLRTVLAETVADHGLHTTNSSTVLAFAEILGPAFAQFASAALREEFFQAFLGGEEGWCQGFSEPGAGSDLAALQTTARRDGDHYVLRGEKVWTSLAQFATRGVILARTGDRDSRHRGISALFVDMDSPGIDVRPLRTMGDRAEFSELHLDDVQVPADRLIGAEGDGWALAMAILGNERASMMWQESAMLRRTFEELLVEVEPERLDAAQVGDAFLDLCAMRATSRQTQHRVARGELPGTAASLDKVLDTWAHQSIFDLVRDALQEDLTLGAGPRLDRWRDEFYYSRAASIYGGTAEIQRNIIAQRLLGLPKG